MREEQGCFISKGYLTLSGDEWEHERPREKQIEKKPSIKERPEGMCKSEQGAVLSRKAYAGTIRRCRYAPL